MMKSSRIRELRENEYDKLEELLYEAIYQPDEDHPVSREVLKIPEVHAYIKDFGKRKDDYALIAESDEHIMGGVWVRILSEEVKGYGNIDSETPEFAISLFKEYRNKGIGTALMKAMIGHLKEKKYRRASLNVKKENYAVNLYKKVGFKIIGEDEQDYLMLLELES